MTTVFVIRHGRTALNADGALRGRVDVPLDEVGLAEAARLGDLFEPVPLMVVVCSPLLRARQTAAPIANSTGASAAGAACPPRRWWSASAAWATHPESSRAPTSTAVCWPGGRAWPPSWPLVVRGSGCRPR